MKGIYEFEGELLKVCFTFRMNSSNTKDFVRPDSFVVKPARRGVYLKFRRVGE